MLESLNALKAKDYFPLDEWEERGLNRSNDEIIHQMNNEVKDFINFLIPLYEANLAEQQIINKIQIYFDNWDRKEFDTEEMEFIFDEFFYIISALNIDASKLEV